MTPAVLVLAAVLLTALWLNRPSRVRADRDRFWLRELAIHDHAIEKGLQVWTDTRRVGWYTPQPVWMAHYDTARDELRDRDEMREEL